MTIAQEQTYLGYSPNSPDSGSMLYDESEAKDLFDLDDIAEEVKDEKPKKSNGRKGSGPGAADKRATHNAIERARRESLNGRFMTLAEALPSMANVKRPSKSIIVNKALDFVFEAQLKEHALIKENNELRLQVDQLRARLGMGPLPPPAPLLPNEVSTPVVQQQASPSVSSSPPAFVQPSATQSAPMSIPMPTMTSMPSPTSIFASPASAVSSPDSPVSLASSESFSAASASSLASTAATFPNLAFEMPQLAAVSGLINPAMLQQQLLFAAHLQQQQQQHGQLTSMDPFAIHHSLATSPHPFDHQFNAASVAAATYSPLQPYFVG